VDVRLNYGFEILIHKEDGVNGPISEANKLQSTYIYWLKLSVYWQFCSWPLAGLCICRAHTK